MNQKQLNQIMELFNYLEAVHTDERERVVSTVEDGWGNTYKEILNREQYLELALEVALTELDEIIAGDAS